MSIISINILMGIKAASPLQKHIKGSVRSDKISSIEKQKKTKGL